MSPRRPWFAPVMRRRLLGAMFVLVCLVIAGESWRYHRQCVALDHLGRLGHGIVWTNHFATYSNAFKQKSPRVLFDRVAEDFLRTFDAEEPADVVSYYLPQDEDMDEDYGGDEFSLEFNPDWWDMQNVHSIFFLSSAGTDALQQYASLWPGVRELLFVCDNEGSQCALTELVHEDLEGCRCFQNLRYPSFTWKKIDLEDAQWMASLPSLRRVLLQECQITSAALEEFRILKAKSRLWSVSIDSHEIK